MSAVTERTIEEKLRALKLLRGEQSAIPAAANGAGATPPQRARQKIPRADSLQVLLQQALHARNVQRVEECLQVQDDRTVAQTVARMDAAHAVLLLDFIVTRFQLVPTRQRQLAKWLRAVLVAHMATLVSSATCATRLAPLYQSMQDRLRNHAALLRLQGRLDVVCEQVKLRSLAVASVP